MGLLIDGIGCEYRFMVGEGRFDAGWFEREFGLGEGDFAPSETPGVLVASSEGGGPGDVWAGDCEPEGVMDALSACEDGSFVEFLDLDRGMWRCYGKDRGEAYMDERPAVSTARRPREAGEGNALGTFSDDELLRELRRRMVVPIAYSREDVADVLCCDTEILESEDVDVLADAIYREIDEKSKFGSPDIQEFDDAWLSFLFGCCDSVIEERTGIGK